MRTVYFSALLILPLSLSASGSPTPRRSWTVAASASLASRLRGELEDLARKDGARIHVVRNPLAGQPSAGELWVTLRGAANLESFLENLKNEVKPLEPSAELAREGYIIEISYSRRSQPAQITLTAADPRGFHNALLRTRELLRIPPSKLASSLAPAPKSVRLDPNGDSAVIRDFPSFPERGIVEGFYGKPWSHEDRLDILRFEGAHGMNVYYYAPKDDPYHRTLWREPYPEREMRRLGELVETARANFVDFCFAISPGLSITYSSDPDLATLTSKLESVGKLGAGCFALFLDDVPQDLQNPDDRAKFKTLAEAHGFLINKLYRHLKSQFPDSRLVVTPTVYTNEWGSRDYVQELGAGVDPEVPLVWTGPKVVSPTITVADAEKWGELLHRKPLIWDNFPVNDGIPWRLNLGPLRGRDPDLPRAAIGLFSNPMNQARASLIPLETIAEYLWNPATYDPEQALGRALVEQYGKDASGKLRTFLTTYGDYWRDKNVFRALFVETREPFKIPPMKKRAAELARNARSLRKQALYRELAKELGPFPSKTQKQMAEVLKDPAFRHLSGQTLQWRADYDALRASRVSQTFQLDGDFGKWEGGTIYTLARREQISTGSEHWRGPGRFSARFALGWDEHHLYVGADVTDPELYQPFSGRDIARGDVVSLFVETAFRRNLQSTQADADEYDLLFSPGDFAQVRPSVFSDEDYLPPRPAHHDYDKEIVAAWKKTPRGFSGDIALPAGWFERGKFEAGYEIGFGFGAQKAFPPLSGNLRFREEIPHIVFRSKSDRLFPLLFGNPSSYQRLVLADSPRR